MLDSHQFVNLFGHYEAYEESLGDLVYLDVKRMPIGIFGNLLLRILKLYESKGMQYVDHFNLSQDDNSHRVTLVFRKESK